MRLLFLLLFLSLTGSRVLAQGTVIITEHGKFELLKVGSVIKVPTVQLFSCQSEEVVKKLLDTLAKVAMDKQSAVFEDVYREGWCQMRRHSYSKKEYLIWWTFGSSWVHQKPYCILTVAPKEDYAEKYITVAPGICFSSATNATKPKT